MHALVTLIVALYTLCLLARAAESRVLCAWWAEMRRMWRAAGVPGRAVAILLVIVCTLTGGSKESQSPVSQLFRLLFWHPSSPWQLAVPASDVAASEAALESASADLAETLAVVDSNEVVTLSFDWAAPARLPSHDRQNVIAWTAKVAPTNIAGTLYEDHYVAFNAMASTNPAVILIEYARTLDDGSVERFSANVTTNSFPQAYPVTLQSGIYTCYWFRCAVPILYTNAVRDWSGEALFGSPADSGKGFDLLGTLVIDDGGDVWVGATTNILFDATTNEFRNGINVTGGGQ
jgi:hypothetical protein